MIFVLVELKSDKERHAYAETINRFNEYKDSYMEPPNFDLNSIMNSGRNRPSIGDIIDSFFETKEHYSYAPTSILVHYSHLKTYIECMEQKNLDIEMPYLHKHIMTWKKGYTVKQAKIFEMNDINKYLFDIVTNDSNLLMKV